MVVFLINAIKIIFLLGFLILIHEAGHFFIAKLFKVKVHEFAIGFGPKILTKQGKETKYELRLIPLGGFVRLEGEETKSEDKRAFNNASIPKRMAIVAAGAIVNIVFGILVFFIIIASIGNNVSTVVDSTVEGFAAEQSGIIAGDEIKRINDKDIKTKSDIDKIVQQSNGEELLIQIERDGKEEEIKLKPTQKETEDTSVLGDIPIYYLGINFKMAENNFVNNIYYAFYRTGEFLGSILESIKMLFTGNVGLDQMMGPVGISSVVSQTTGFVEFIYLLAIISISLGVTNLLPIPALDGGKLLILLIEAIRRKPMKEELELGIQMVGFIILISLSIVISYKDITRIF